MRALALLLPILFPVLAAADDCTPRCRLTRKACVVQTRADRPAMRADCRDLGAGKPCLRDAARRIRTSLGACRAAFQECQRCCGTGATAIECSTGCDGAPLESTWKGIQQIFQTRGCTEQACHGAARQGGLDLSADVAYDNLVQVRAALLDMPRVQPGDERRSLLFLKLAAATDPALVPDGIEVGTPMPNGGRHPLSADELEAFRKWIYAGAPETGTVADTDRLLGACLPPPKPIRIWPLDAPAPDQGFQLRLPTFRLKAHDEVEYCYATYYDLTNVVPKEYQDATGTSFLWNRQELRQDPQSHHLIINRNFGTNVDMHDPAFGTWVCAGGRKNGRPCDPVDLASCGANSACVAWGPPHCEAGPRNQEDCDLTDPNACGEGGRCIHGPRQTFACIGFGPGTGIRAAIPIGGAQKAQSLLEFPDGVYAAIPLKGVIYWNPHAFNLSDRDTAMHGWINYYYTRNTKWFVRTIFNASRIFSANAAPFTKQEICNDHVLPQGTYLYSLSSHTHRHGEYFWVTGPASELLYENYVYNDPPTRKFDPPLVFDSPDPATRTLRYCARFNNGLKSDETADTALVTRASRVPPNAPAFSKCQPVACVAGKVTAACRTDAECDTAPGAADGRCDACRITGGESTENEMFILIGQYYVP